MEDALCCFGVAWPRQKPGEVAKRGWTIRVAVGVAGGVELPDVDISPPATTAALNEEGP